LFVCLFVCFFLCLFLSLYCVFVCLFVWCSAAKFDLMLTLAISRFHAAASPSVQLCRSKSETEETILTQIHILDGFSQLLHSFVYSWNPSAISQCTTSKIKKWNQGNYFDTNSHIGQIRQLLHSFIQTFVKSNLNSYQRGVRSQRPGDTLTFQMVLHRSRGTPISPISSKLH